MNRLLALSAFSGFLIVTLGAFGTHGLQSIFDNQARDWWQTATFYGLVHSVMASLIALHQSQLQMKTAPFTGAAFLIGVVIFSGSLYAIALGAPKWLGALTPIGGVGFLAGWISLFYSALKKTDIN